MLPVGVAQEVVPADRVRFHLLILVAVTACAESQPGTAATLNML